MTATTDGDEASEALSPGSLVFIIISDAAIPVV